MAFTLFKTKRNTDCSISQASFNDVGPGKYDPGAHHMARSTSTAPFTTMSERFMKIKNNIPGPGYYGGLPQPT